MSDAELKAKVVEVMANTKSNRRWLADAMWANTGMGGFDELAGYVLDALRRRMGLDGEATS